MEAGILEKNAQWLEGVVLGNWSQDSCKYHKQGLWHVQYIKPRAHWENFKQNGSRVWLCEAILLQSSALG